MEASLSPGSLIDGEIRYKTSIDVGRQTQFCTHQTVGLRQRHHDGRIPAWDHVCHLKERATSSYSRLSNLLLRISEMQPLATTATIELLSKTIEHRQVRLMQVMQLFLKQKLTGIYHDTKPITPQPGKSSANRYKNARSLPSI